MNLNRFDLIFLMLDPQDELYDKRLARHLVSLYYSADEEAESEFMVISIFQRIFFFSFETVILVFSIEIRWTNF